jgi:hypothetical protein
MTTLKFPQLVPQSINLQIAYELVQDAVERGWCADST